MSATIIKTEAKGITVELFIPILSGKQSMGMLEREELIQQSINRAGQLATQYALAQFDTNGSPITVNGKKQTSKGQVSKTYQTPYGETVVYRHVYQTNAGGSTFCPLDSDARIISGSTPKLAKMISSKYSESCVNWVQKDMEDNHNRHLSRQFIQSLSRSTGALITEKQNWNYTIDVPVESVSTIGVSIDTTCLIFCNDGYSRATVGSISLYDSGGERLNSRYTAYLPENGKEQIHQSFDLEIKRIRTLYPKSFLVGVDDGTPESRIFLQGRVDAQILDFFHAGEYLFKASLAAFNRKAKANEWHRTTCHTLKNSENGTVEVLKALESLLEKQVNDKKKEIIQSSIAFIRSHLHYMEYYKYQQAHWPVGSGIMESAGEEIIRQRLCHSGMKWTDNGVRTVLALRCFNKSDGMWQQFWNKVNRHGR